MLRQLFITLFVIGLILCVVGLGMLGFNRSFWGLIVAGPVLSIGAYIGHEVFTGQQLFSRTQTPNNSKT